MALVNKAMWLNAELINIIQNNGLIMLRSVGQFGGLRKVKRLIYKMCNIVLKFGQLKNVKRTEASF